MRNTQVSATHDLPRGIGAPAARALAAAGITRLEQLTTFSESELLKLHGVGPAAIRVLREALSQRRLKFAPSADSHSVSAMANARIPRRPRKK
jgi:predicted flap endonuclease-1-like 5' DNA nuclease